MWVANNRGSNLHWNKLEWPFSSDLLKPVNPDCEAINMWILLALLVTSVAANDNLRVAYQWKQIDFEFPNIDERQAAITNLTFISENIIPVGLEVYKNRLFVTLPRWKKGVAASLAYIDLNGNYMALNKCRMNRWEQ